MRFVPNRMPGDRRYRATYVVAPPDRTGFIRHTAKAGVPAWRADHVVPGRRLPEQPKAD
jgi:hypothetical protein